VVNGPGGESLGWDAVSWRQAEENVRRLRQRIFAASRAAGCSRAFRACLSRLPGKRAWPVLRGPRRSNAPGLPDEIFFSIIQKKVVTPNDFASTTELSQTLLAFVDRYNLTARPFNWKFTADDLTALLGRISEREQKPPTHPPADLAPAA
jgi:hypothetical protein